MSGEMPAINIAGDKRLSNNTRVGLHLPTSHVAHQRYCLQCFAYKKVVEMHANRFGARTQMHIASHEPIVR